MTDLVDGGFDRLYGASMVLAVLVTAWLSWRVIQKFKRPEVGADVGAAARAMDVAPGQSKRFGFVSSAFVVLVLGSMNLLFFPFVVVLGGALYTAVAVDKYPATVTDKVSEWVEQTDNSRSTGARTRRTLMHTAIVTVHTTGEASGDVVGLKNSVRSGEPPVIGSGLRVAWDGRSATVSEVSVRSVSLYLALGVMLALIGAVLLLITRWALDLSNERVGTVIWRMVLTIVVPGAMLVMDALMAYALWQHISGVKSFPLWVVAFLGASVVVLTLALWQSVFGREPPESDAEHDSSNLHDGGGPWPPEKESKT